jgi:hypothetical protein
VPSRSPHADWSLLARVNAWVSAGLVLLVLASPVVVLIGYLEGDAGEGWSVAGWMLLFVGAVLVLRVLPRILGRLVRGLVRGPAVLRRGLRELHEAHAALLADVEEPARSRLAALPTRTWLRLQLSLSRLAWGRLRVRRDLEDPHAAIDRLESEVAAGALDHRLERIARRVPARYGVDVTDLRVLVATMARDDADGGAPRPRPEHP